MPPISISENRIYTLSDIEFNYLSIIIIRLSYAIESILLY